MQLSSILSLVSLHKCTSFPFIIFQHFKFSYWFYVLYEAIPWRNKKKSGRNRSNIFIRCKQSLPTNRLLFRTSLCIATITVSFILQQFGILATLIGQSCIENNELQFLLFGPYILRNYLTSRCFVTKITILTELHVHQHKKVTSSTTWHFNSTSYDINVKRKPVARSRNI
jgi:hypothetical protein